MTKNRKKPPLTPFLQYNSCVAGWVANYIHVGSYVGTGHSNGREPPAGCVFDFLRGVWKSAFISELNYVRPVLAIYLYITYSKYLIKSKYDQKCPKTPQKGQKNTPPPDSMCRGRVPTPGWFISLSGWTPSNTTPTLRVGVRAIAYLDFEPSSIQS